MVRRRGSTGCGFCQKFFSGSKNSVSLSSVLNHVRQVFIFLVCVIGTQCIHLFMYSFTHLLTRHVTTRRQEPVTSHDKRVMFAKGLYDAVLVPLNPFEGGVSPWTDLFREGWGEKIQQVSSMSSSDRKSEATFSTWARGDVIRPVPNPTNAAGQKLCHGAILNFDVRPPHLHSTIALRRWLKSRNVSIPTNKRHTYLGK